MTTMTTESVWGLRNSQGEWFYFTYQPNQIGLTTDPASASVWLTESLAANAAKIIQANSGQSFTPTPRN